ncbi:MAG TPA: arginase [Nitrososphaerales archaeon]|nr:arginase [Nitrososphaerales archaeon]
MSTKSNHNTPSHKKREIEIIGVPLDLGADRRGVDMGPSAIRYAGLSEKLRSLGLSVRDSGNLLTPIAEVSKMGNSNAKYLGQVSEVCLRLSKAVSDSMEAGRFPLVLGGDHSIAIGTLAGARNALIDRVSRDMTKDDFGVLWLDAHGDYNTPEITPSGNIHGMSLAISSGHGGKWFPSPPWPARAVDPKKIAIVGARQLDAEERLNLKKTGVRVFSMADIDRLGMEAVMSEALEIASSDGNSGIHVSFDIDVVDPSEAPGVGTPVRGGITYREAHLAMEMIHESSRMMSLELVEVNPILDQQNATAELAVELILSSMGKTIF